MVASPEDLRQVSPLESYPLDRATVLHWLMQRDAGYVLDDGAELVAYGELVGDDQDPDLLWIGHMVVHPRRRGLGLGQRLVHELLRVAEHERFAREVGISAFADNARALRAYERCGFERVERERIEGRPLVGMRLRFASRRRAPGRAWLLGSGLGALIGSGGVWLAGSSSGVRLLALAISMGALAAGALVGHRFTAERRDRFARRASRALVPVAVGQAMAAIAGLLVLGFGGQPVNTWAMACVVCAVAWAGATTVVVAMQGRTG